MGLCYSKRIVTYEVEPSDTVLDLKRKIRSRENLPLFRMRLTYNSKPLENNEQLRVYNIRQESTISGRMSCGGSSYCAGCIQPALICLSANVSLQCAEQLSSCDNTQLLYSIRTKLNSLDTNALNAVIYCLETCSKQWNELQIDDTNFFQNHEEQRKSDAIDLFIGAICRMINDYLKKYRTLEILKDIKDIFTEPTKVDWFKIMHETRCPICFCRFTSSQSTTDNESNRYFDSISVSTKTNVPRLEYQWRCVPLVTNILFVVIVVKVFVDVHYVMELL